MDKIDFLKKSIINCINNNMIDTSIKIYKDNFGETEKIIEFEMRYNTLNQDLYDNIINAIDYRREKTMMLISYIKHIHSINELNIIF